MDIQVLNRDHAAHIRSALRSADLGWRSGKENTVRIGKHLAAAVIGVVLMSPAIPIFSADSGTGLSGASQSQPVDPGAPASAYSMDVPLAYYNLSFTLSKRTGGIPPPRQGRIIANFGL